MARHAALLGLRHGCAGPGRTQLVRFGAREYDPISGRWIAADPTLYAGMSNFYVYADNDPINRIDPSGTIPIAPIVAGAVWGAGLELGIQLLTNGGKFGCVDWAAVAVSGAIGALTGTLGVLGQGAEGFEFSHFVPRRTIRAYGFPKWLINSSLNGNYVPWWFHAATDTYRYQFVPAALKSAIPEIPAGLAQVLRIPAWIFGGGAGAAAVEAR